MDNTGFAPIVVILYTYLDSPAHNERLASFDIGDILGRMSSEYKSHSLMLVNE